MLELIYIINGVTYTYSSNSSSLSDASCKRLDIFFDARQGCWIKGVLLCFCLETVNIKEEKNLMKYKKKERGSQKQRKQLGMQ